MTAGHAVHASLLLLVAAATLLFASHDFALKGEFDRATYWSGPTPSADGLALEKAFLQATAKNKLEFLYMTSAILPAIVTGYELKLFQILAEADLSFDEVQVALNISERSAEALLVTLVGSNIIEQNQVTGRLSLSDVYMLSNNGRILSLLFKFFFQKQFFYYTESTVADEPIGLRKAFNTDAHDLYAFRSSDPKLASIWDPAMDIFNGNIERDLQIIFDRMGETIHVLDVCGNEGNNAMRIARVHPHAKFTVADLPGQVQRAAQNFMKAGLADRIDTTPVDWLKPSESHLGNEIAEGVYMLHAVSIFNYAQLDTIFRAVMTALRPGGIFMFDTVTVLPKGKFRSDYINVMDVYFVSSATSTHRAKYLDELRPLLIKIGFQSIELAAQGQIVSENDPSLSNFDSFMWRQLYLIAKK